MNARLLYVMDPMCSWCWGFAPVFDALAAQAQEAGLGVQLLVGGLRPGTAQALDGATRDYILGHWRAVAERTGQAFGFDGALPEGFVYDTEPACRALVTVRSLAPERVWPLLQAIQQAFYLEGRDVSRAAVLVELAETVGVARAAFAEAFDSVAQRAATQADFARVENFGIAGFPTLLAERHGQLALLTNGYQPLERLAPLLDRWLERRAHG
jgi:putative protein-disulfide isomerase